MRKIGLFVFAMLAMAFAVQEAEARLFQRLRERRQSHSSCGNSIVRSAVGGLLGGGCSNGNCSR